jgi:hypothetical protein
MQSTRTEETLTPAHRHAVLGVMCLALMMVVAAVASLNVALPDLARGTGASQSQLQWIVDAYALVFAGLLLPAGALGDRYGRKGILLIGLGDVDAVGAKRRHHSLRIVRCDHRLRALSHVENEPYLFPRPAPVEIEPVPEVGAAPQAPFAEREAAERNLGDCSDLGVGNALRVQEQPVPTDDESMVRARDQAVVLHHVSTPSATEQAITSPRCGSTTRSSPNSSASSSPSSSPASPTPREPAVRDGSSRPSSCPVTKPTRRSRLRRAC